MAYTMENCKRVIKLYYITDVNSVLKMEILICLDKVLLFVGGRLIPVDGIEISNTVSDLFKKINCTKGAIDIVSNRDLNSILQDILRTPLYATFPLIMNMYTVDYFNKLTQRIQKLDNDHIAVAVAEYALRE